MLLVKGRQGPRQGGLRAVSLGSWGRAEHENRGIFFLTRSIPHKVPPNWPTVTGFFAPDLTAAGRADLLS